MKIYIAGPITGKIDYKQKFMGAEMLVKDLGHIAINPSFLPEGLKHYMDICIAMLDQADGILLLPGWEKSKGALQEYEHAKLTGKAIYEEVYSGCLRLIIQKGE